VTCEDAIDLMHMRRKDKDFFDVIDLDPYGTAVPFLDSAIQSISNGGMMAITFTDMAVLCSKNPEVCFYKYGAIPNNKFYCHEVFQLLIISLH
jgi:tRNA (guanine26-N2/guanine27-N2)-dimethyltransferase